MDDDPRAELVRLRGLNAVYQALSAIELSAFSIPLLLQTILETSTKLTGAQYGALGVFDESGTKLTEFLTVGLDEETKAKIKPMPMGFGLLGAMDDEPGVLRLRDLTRHPKSVGFPPHHPAMKSFLGVSIRAHGRLFGRLYLTEKQGAEEFSEIDAEIVAALASQTGTILERGLLIQQLKFSESRHRRTLESAAEGIYELDLEGTCTFINKPGAAMLGYGPEELIGRRMHGLIHHSRPDGSPYPEEECPTGRARRHGRPSQSVDDTFWRMDGTAFPVQLSCGPILSDGALRGVVVTFLDVSERRESELRKALDHGIARAVVESASSDEANKKILQTICEVLDWEWSAVWHVDKPAGVLRSLTVWHKPEVECPEFEAVTGRTTFAPGVGLPGRVWATGRAHYIPDFSRDQNFPRGPLAARGGLHGGFAFPILLEGAVVGVMEFFSRTPHEPSRNVLNTLSTLGSQIGLQIDRKRVEEALRERERTFATLMSNLPGMAYRCRHDRDWTLLFASEGTLRLTGYPPDEFTEKRIHFAQLIHPDDLGAVWNDVQAAIDSRLPFQLTFRIRTAAGEEKWVWEQGRGVFSPQGGLQFLEGFIIDITERKRAEEAVSLFRTLIDHANDAIEVMEPATARFLDGNEKAWSSLGYTREEFLRLSVPDIDPLVPLPVYRQYMDRFRADPAGGGVTLESLHRRKDGSTFPVEVNCRLVRLERDYALAIARDITERKQAEEALLDAHRRLQQAQEDERKRIARELHDELGQQLTLIRFELLKLVRAEAPAQLRQQAQALIKATDTMIATVRRVATALRPGILDDLGLQAALEWLVTDFRNRTGIRCEAALEPVPENLDEVRSVALFRILQEALTNVARHAQSTRVTIRLQRTAEALVLEVRDNGRGITDAHLTGSNSIGLFGMQERALLVGGRVSIEGRPGEGTTVTARIPLR
jgi:PAS domain S-box-containing protein